MLICYEYEATVRFPPVLHRNGYDVVMPKEFSVVVPDASQYWRERAEAALMKQGNNSGDEYFRLLDITYILIDLVLDEPDLR